MHHYQVSTHTIIHNLEKFSSKTYITDWSWSLFSISVTSVFPSYLTLILKICTLSRDFSLLFNSVACPLKLYAVLLLPHLLFQFIAGCSFFFIIPSLIWGLLVGKVNAFPLQWPQATSQSASKSYRDNLSGILKGETSY